jgi:cytoskeletal protein CcmA (bactofilin family)
VFRELFGSPKPKKAVPASAKPAPAAPAVPTASQSVLGAGTHFEGTLRAESHVRVDGTFIGDISTRGRILIGEQAKVVGNLIGEAVDVAGMVTGDVIARRISVTRTGRILGDLRLEKLLTEEGGFIQGLVRMEDKVTVAEYLPAKSKPADEPLAETETVKEPVMAERQPDKDKVPVKAAK